MNVTLFPSEEREPPHQTGHTAHKVGLVFAALLLPHAVNYRASVADRTGEAALRVHVLHFLRGADDFATYQQDG